MLAGDVAKKLGIGVQTLHYYEHEHLIPPPKRAENGYRVYSDELVERVRFVRKAQSLGLTLEEIKGIVDLAERGTCPCGHVHSALAARLAEVDDRLRELRSFRRELAALVTRAAAEANSGRQRLEAGDATAGKLCAIVEQASTPVRLVRAGVPLGLKRRQTSPAAKRP